MIKVSELLASKHHMENVGADGSTKGTA